MTLDEQGGPAFPQVFTFAPGSFDPVAGRQLPANEAAQYVRTGMTLRDFYACYALQGMLARPNSSPSGHPKTASGYAAAAFEFADAMLIARGA